MYDNILYDPRTQMGPLVLNGKGLVFFLGGCLPSKIEVMGL